MRILIDIPEDIRVAIGQMGLLRIPNEMQKKVDKAIQHGTPIPDNATNGEVIDLIFPYEKTIDKVWWNEPYQKGGKE